MSSPAFSSPAPHPLTAPQLSKPVGVIDISRIPRTFRFVSYANYFMLVVCGWTVVAMLIALFQAHSAPELIFIVLSLLINGFAAWVGWKNIGVLGAVVHGYTKLALVLLSLFTLGTVLVLWPGISAGDASESAFLSFTVAVMTATVAIAGLLALMRLSWLKLPVLGLKLRAFLTQSLPGANPARHHLPAANPGRGAMFGLLGVAWLTGVQLIPTEWLPEAVRRQLWQVSQLGYVFLIYARQYFQPSFATVMADDKRPPVVFLRSFADDEKVNYLRADSSLFDFSLESRLAGHFNALGPFIAVAAPKDQLPHLGAARAALSDDEWQATVAGWMSQSALIIVMAGTTHWIDWELKKIIDLSEIRS